MDRMKTQTSLQSLSTLRNNEEHKEENGIIFCVNKGGFPINDKTWDRMWNHVIKIHPEGKELITKIKQATSAYLPQVAVIPPPLNLCTRTPVAGRLEKIQDYMRELQYNHTGTQFFEIRKNRPINGLMECAKMMIREALPIKCLEAVILGIFFTNGMLGVERYPISFKSCFLGHTHHHVVLGISYGGRYGAIGMSRREDLMYKPLIFKSLSELIFDFEKCYKNYWHEVKKIRIGLPVTHDPHSYEMIHWGALTVDVPVLTEKEIYKSLEQHSKEIRSESKAWTCLPQTSLKLITAYADHLPVKQNKNTPKLMRSMSCLTQSTSPAASPFPPAKNSTKSTSTSTYEIRI